MSIPAPAEPLPLNLERSKTGLVVIDLQKGIASIPTQPHEVSVVVANAVRLAEAFRKNGMPVFLVHVVSSEADRLRPIADQQPWASTQQRPKDWADFIPELGPKESDVVIAKKQWGAFYGTELELQLRRKGLDTIVLCGISTNAGVESTARFAYEYGFQQVFAEDAMAARSAEEHGNSLNHTFKRIGRVRSTDQVIAALAALA
ncbi:MAG: hydrolase [Thaumarchaeota archaeon]|nr:hydrolase [Nitrososphaerota archaeon]